MPELAPITIPERRPMPLRNVVEHANERGHEGDAEAGGRLFCPNPACAGPVLAVLSAGGAS